MQSQTTSDIGAQGEILARAYIDALAKSEGVKMQSMFRRRVDSDPVDNLLSELEAESDPEAPQLRADLVAAAVLTAKAIATEPGLAKDLRRAAPVISIQTHTGDMVAPVAEIITHCATAETTRKQIVSRDGTERGHAPEKGNADVVAALNKRWPVVGIAPDPRRHLPSSLMRTAECHLALPAMDEAALRLVLEAVTGKRYDGPIDPDLVRAADISDLSLALRHDLKPEQCLERLAKTISNKADFVADGPRLEDLDGYGEAKTWGLELVADLRDYRAGRMGWDAVDHKGLLLSGPPGTGKTMFAKALAKSAGVALVSTSVAQWNSANYLSGTLQAIRDCFGQAKRMAPAILFIDEIDGISSRDVLRGDYVEYWTQIVNLLLEMLAGIDDRAGVVVVAATNFPDKIDAAIRRAGRLDREIQLQKPDFDTLVRIFRHHLGESVLAGVDLLPVALAARDATGADVEAWVRRAKGSVRRQRREMTIEDLLVQIRGNASPVPRDVRHRVAVHEAGHIVVAKVLGVGNVVRTSLINNGGITELSVAVDGNMTEATLSDHLVFALAGRAAEEMLLGVPALGSANGPASDLAKATDLAMLLEAESGYGVCGLVYRGERPSWHLMSQPAVFEAIKRRLDLAIGRARDILAANRNPHGAVTEALEVRGYLSGADIDALLAGLASKNDPQWLEAVR